MPTVNVNGVDLFYEIEGDGPPLVVVHGSWTDHTAWQGVADRLAGSFQLIRYDRRGCSRSERPAGPRARSQDEDDLAGLIETFADGRANVVASSYGGLVTLGLAARRPELLSSLCIHEAPSLSLGRGDEDMRVVDEVRTGMAEVVAQIEAGDNAGAARRFVEDFALGPGGWELLPESIRAAFVNNAPAFAGEQSDPNWSDLDIPGIQAAGHQILLTRGTVSPLWLRLLQDRLAEALPDAETAPIEGAGHSPHISHPDEFAALIAAFVGVPSARA